MGLLFLKTYPVKQYSYENDFSGAFDALHQSFLGVFFDGWSDQPQLQTVCFNTEKTDFENDESDDDPLALTLRSLCLRSASQTLLAFFRLFLFWSGSATLLHHHVQSIAMTLVVSNVSYVSSEIRSWMC